MPQPVLDTGIVLAIIGCSLVGGVVLLISIFYLIRWCRSRGSRGSSNFVYDKVNHELDEEEIEFKNMIENKGLDFDDFGDDIFEDSKEDLTFNSKEKNSLSMLEKLRSNLVSSANMDTENGNSEDEVSDNDRIRL